MRLSQQLAGRVSRTERLLQEKPKTISEEEEISEPVYENVIRELTPEEIQQGKQEYSEQQKEKLEAEIKSQAEKVKELVAEIRRLKDLPENTKEQRKAIEQQIEYIEGRRVALEGTRGMWAGEYKTEDIIDYAYSKAYGEEKKLESSRARKEQQKIIEKQLIEKGLTPTYQQVGVEKILIGYIETTIPKQKVVSPPLTSKEELFRKLEEAKKKEVKAEMPETKTIISKAWESVKNIRLPIIEKPLWAIGEDTTKAVYKQGVLVPEKYTGEKIWAGFESIKTKPIETTAWRGTTMPVTSIPSEYKFKYGGEPAIKSLIKLGAVPSEILDVSLKKLTEYSIATPTGLHPKPTESLVLSREQQEKIARRQEKILGFVPYAIPYVGTSLLASTFFKGIKTYAYPEEDFGRIKEQSYKEYLKAKLPEGYEHLTKAEYEAQVIPEMKKSYRLGGLLTAGISGTLLFGSLVKYLKTPTIKTINYMPKVPKADLSISGKPFQRIIQYAPTPEGTTIIDLFKVKGKQYVTAPGQRAIVSTKWRDILGIKPIYEGIYKADKIGYEKALNLLTKKYKAGIIQEHFGLGLTKEQAQALAKKQIRFYQPISVEVLTKGFSKLITTPKEQKALFDLTRIYKDYPQTLETLKLKTGDYPIRTKPIQKIEFEKAIKIPTPKENIFKVISDVETARLKAGKYPYVNIKDLGKLRTKYLGYQKVEVLATKPEDIIKGFETLGYKTKKIPDGILFDTKALIKKIIPSEKKLLGFAEKQFVILGEPPIIITRESPIKIKEIITPTKPIFKEVKFTTEQAKDIMKDLRKIYGKPTKQITEQIKKLITPPIQIKGIATKKILKEITIPKIETGLKGLPKMAGGLGLIPSEYTGTKYGVPISIKDLIEETQIKEARKIKPYYPEKELYVPILVELQIPKLKTKEKHEVSLLPKLDLKTLLAETEVLRVEQNIKQRLKPAQIQAQVPTQSLKQQLKQQQKTINQAIITPRNITPTQPIPRKPIKPITSIPLPNFNKQIRDIEEKALGYRLSVKRYGKFEAYPTILPKSLALSKGEEIVRKTLAATFKIEPTKIAVKAIMGKGLIYPEIFRTYKIQKGVEIPLENTFIQKRKYRLGTFGEVEEIQLARQMKNTNNIIKQAIRSARI